MRLTALIVILTIVACSCKKKIDDTMIVVKGCEGGYLRLNNLDYTICNEDKLVSFTTGTHVKAVMVRRNECFCFNSKTHCITPHNHATAEGIYEILKISSSGNQ